MQKLTRNYYFSFLLCCLPFQISAEIVPQLKLAPEISNNYYQNDADEFQVDDYYLSREREPENSEVLRLVNDRVEEGLNVSGIIVTVYSGNSYDNLFRKEEQKAEDGDQVLVYSLLSRNVAVLYDAFQSDEENNLTSNNESGRGVLGEFFTQIRILENECPSCIVFNWECSSGYDDKRSPEGERVLFGFLKFLLDRGYMTMFSDFSLKALIGLWDESLGPNPFEKLGETSSSIDLRFDNDELVRSPSSQLQIVGHLAQKGFVNVHVLGGTIVYGVDSNRKQTDLYELSVLTIAGNQRADSRYISRIGDYSGTAGHVLLRYRESGGMILTSMGHWIELLAIDTSAKKVYELIEEKYGASSAQDFQIAYASVAESDQQSFVNSYAAKEVQQNSPGSYNSKNSNL